LLAAAALAQQEREKQQNELIEQERLQNAAVADAARREREQLEQLKRAAQLARVQAGDVAAVDVAHVEKVGDDVPLLDAFPPLAGTDVCFAFVVVLQLCFDVCWCGCRLQKLLLIKQIKLLKL